MEGGSPGLSATFSWNMELKVERYYMSFSMTTMKKEARNFWNQTFFYFGIGYEGVWACVTISPLQSWKRLHILRSNSSCNNAGMYAQAVWLQNLTWFNLF